ncbi:hypothetical protein ABZ805_15780 [Saccharopolyspora sp. NPDC047091]|uniref:hypothetical protein n=1 Tax=Saccharopolyspora sp. NPDC047091 TaxID=3155924 RepID=UPI003409CF7F
MSTGTAVLAVLVTTCSCGSAEPPDLFADYLGSTAVVHDRFPAAGTSEDRLADFAAYYTPDELAAELFRAFPCEEPPSGEESGSNEARDRGAARCDAGRAVRRAAAEHAPDARLHGRAVLVGYADGGLELGTVYVATAPAARPLLIDGTGRTYPGGLADFRRHNDLFSPADHLLVPSDPADVAGGGELVVVTARTSTTWPWLIGLGGPAVLLFAWALLRYAARAREAEHAESVLVG